MATVSPFKAVDLKNFLDGLGNSSTGHTHLTLLQELIDNSLDANANDIIIKTEGNDLIINDNGNGMNIDELCRCLQFYSKNSNKNTIGKFGIGGSTAIVSLSRQNMNEEIMFCREGGCIIQLLDDGGYLRLSYVDCANYYNKYSFTYTEKYFDDKGTEKEPVSSVIAPKLRLEKDGSAGLASFPVGSVTVLASS